MKELPNDIKLIMSFLFARDSAQSFEFTFDKRDNHFMARLFLSEGVYWLIEPSDKSGYVKVREYRVSKCYYYPTSMVTYINKYLKKYRNGYNYSAELSLNDLYLVLDKLPKPKLASDRDSYSPWREIRRATVRF